MEVSKFLPIEWGFSPKFIVPIMQKVYKVLLFSVHVIISFLFLLYQLVMRMRRKVKEFGLVLLASSEAERLEMLKSKILGFVKLPSHVGFVVNEDKISFSDIANIITWCLALGVPHVSVYDRGGIVKTESLCLYKESIKSKEKLLKSNTSKFKLTFHHKNISPPFDFRNGVTNGCVAQNETQVHLMSWSSGRQALVTATKEMCNKQQSGQRLTDRHKLSFHLATFGKCPDPELVVCFGSGYSLIGFSPWHIHLSEFVFQESHHNYHLSQFVEVLEKYSKCEQRFGK